MSRLVSLHFSHGDLLMLAANLSWALYNVLGRRFMPPGSSLGNTTLVMAFGAVILFSIALGSGAQVHEPGIKASLALAVMVTGGTVLAYLFWSIGILRLGAGRTSIFLNLVPVSAMVVGAGLGTPPTMAQVAGGILVLAAVSVAMLPQRRAAMA